MDLTESRIESTADAGPRAKQPCGRPSPIHPQAMGTASRIEAFVMAHPRLVPVIQLVMVLVYMVLILVPPWLPAPGPDATPTTDFVRFAQFAIWAIWWPFVLLSLIPFGRAWCGIFCPEGALAQWASRIAMQWRVPRFLTWGGTP